MGWNSDDEGAAAYAESEGARAQAEAEAAEAEALDAASMRHDKRNIADRTEQELIQCILEIYSGDVQACLRISQHIAEKLTQHRKIIRERRGGREPHPNASA